MSLNPPPTWHSILWWKGFDENFSDQGRLELKMVAGYSKSRSKIIAKFLSLSLFPSMLWLDDHLPIFSLSMSQCLSLSLTFSHTHAHTHTQTNWIIHTHSFLHRLPHTTNSNTYTRIPHTLTWTHVHILTHVQTLLHTLQHTPKLSLSLFL